MELQNPPSTVPEDVAVVAADVLTPTVSSAAAPFASAGPPIGLLAYQPTGTGPENVVSPKVAARILASIPESTRRTYTSDWNDFTAWCAGAGRTALPATAETLAEFVSARADDGQAPKTLQHKIAAIRVIHRLSALPPPDTTATRAVLKSYRAERARDGKPNVRRAAALSIRELKLLVDACDGPVDPGSPLPRPRSAAMVARDRLLIVLGWAMMARRGELTALDISDVTEIEHGLDVVVRASKNDLDFSGRVVAVPYGSDPDTCPVRLLRAWLAILAENQITSGPLFRRINRHGHVGGAADKDHGRLTGHGLRVVLKTLVLRAGLDPDKVRPHSLRAGGATGAYLGGADPIAITRHGGWADGSNVVFGYIRDVDRWTKNPMHGAGL